MSETQDAYDVMVVADQIKRGAQNLLDMLSSSELATLWDRLGRDGVRGNMMEAIRVCQEIQRGIIDYLDVTYADVNEQTRL